MAKKGRSSIITKAREQAGRGKTRKDEDREKFTKKKKKKRGES